MELPTMEGIHPRMISIGSTYAFSHHVMNKDHEQLSFARKDLGAIIMCPNEEAFGYAKQILQTMGYMHDIGAMNNQKGRFNDMIQLREGGKKWTIMTRVVPDKITGPYQEIIRPEIFVYTAAPPTAHQGFIDDIFADQLSNLILCGKMIILGRNLIIEDRMRSNTFSCSAFALRS